MTSEKTIGEAPVVYVAAGALFNIATQSVLMCQRPAHKAHPHEWEFPGGKIESGETPQQALARELREELGIETNPDQMMPAGFISHAYPEAHVVMLLFLVEEWHGAIILHEHQAMQWVVKEELTQFAVLPADKPLLEQLLWYL